MNEQGRDLQAKQLRRRNIVVLVMLVGVAALFYTITLLRVGGH